MRQRPAIRSKGVIAAARLQRASATGQRLAFRVDPLSRKVVRPLLITLLATSVAIALLVIVRVTSPERLWMAIVPLVFLAAMEGAYTTAWLNNPDSHGVDRGLYRAAEIFLILILARIYSWAFFGGGIPSPDEMRQFLTSPISLLAVGGFVTTALVTLVAWWLAVTFSRIFTRLDVSVYEVNFYTMSPAEQKAKADDRPIQIPREILMANFLTTWLTGAILMILVAALSTYDMGQLITVANPFEITRLGLSPAMLFALLIYFLAGFWLLSHARLLRMNARWLMDGVAKEASMERKWQRSALLVILAVALVALFLPIGSSLAISRILTLALSGIGYLINVVFSIFAYVVGSALLFFTQNVEATAEQPPVTVPRATVQPPTIPPADPNSLTTMVISTAFWALLIAFIIATILFFLRERGYRLDRGRVSGYWLLATGWLRDFWSQLTKRVKSIRRELRATIGSVQPPQLDMNVAKPRYIRLNALSPRDQIRYYYLALVRRATERGVKRRESETPLEFVQQLTDMWPESEEELEELTNAFMEARYSSQPIEKSEASSIRELWHQLKLRLRTR